MIEWSDSQLLIRDTVRRFVEDEIAPNVEQLEHGDLPPYDLLRKLYSTFGMDEMARARFAKQIEREKKGETAKPKSSGDVDPAAKADQAAAQLIPIIELCRYCPGMVTAMGVSIGLTAGAILSKGTVEQKERWAPDLLSLDKVGAWAITEPGSGSDAFGGMRSSARREGDEFVLNGSKTFITNGPHADTTVFICKLEQEGVDPRDRQILNFVLDRGMPGFEQSASAPQDGPPLLAHRRALPQRTCASAWTACSAAKRRSNAAAAVARARRAPFRRSARVSPPWPSASSTAASSSR